MVVNRALAIPLHDQIRRLVHGQIAAGELKPGDQLPPEHEFAKRLGVSLAPVRQALVDLSMSGHLDRIKGRGTFVRAPKLEESISLLASFTDDLRDKGRPLRIRVLTLLVERPSREIARELHLDRRSRVVRLRRLADIDGAPAAVLDAFLPADRFARLVEIEGFGAGRSLYRTLDVEFGTRVGRARSTLEVVRCDDDQAELLTVAVGTPALLVRSVTQDANDELVEAAHVLYRADRFRFVIDSHR